MLRTCEKVKFQCKQITTFKGIEKMLLRACLIILLLMVLLNGILFFKYVVFF
jgi:cell division protein FtsL